MTLIELLTNLDQYDPEAVILAEPPWRADSRALTIASNASDYTTLEQDGLTYVMPVFAALLTLDEFRENGLSADDHVGFCQALIARAQNEPTPFDPPRPVLPQKKQPARDYTGAPPEIYDGYISTWRLKRAAHLAEQIRAMGYEVRRAPHDVLDVDVGSFKDADAARFLGAMRDLGFVFSQFPKDFGPIDAINQYREQGLLTGDFHRLSFTRTGRWRTALIPPIGRRT